MQFIDISEIKDYNTIMQVEDLKEYFAQKQQDLELWESESLESEKNQSLQEELKELEDLLQELNDNNVSSLINSDYFEEFLRNDFQENHNIPDYAMCYIILKSDYRDNIEYEFTLDSIAGEDYYYQHGR
jgi:hypothetical protein